MIQRRAAGDDADCGDAFQKMTIEPIGSAPRWNFGCGVAMASQKRFSLDIQCVERTGPDIALRYALYATPAADHPLTRAAASWLGRDAYDGRESELPSVEGLASSSIETYLADPARYGFHATLKAPFSMADGQDEAGLIAAIDAFAARSQPIEIPELVIRRLGRFYAFVPNEPVRALDDWVGQIVTEFEPFRAPLSEADIARRRVAGLTLAEEANLIRWGYPYVFDAFRFHMSLTGRVPKEDLEPMETALRARFKAFDGRPLSIDRLALFVEPERGAPFLHRHVALLR
jgi:putative phosphonate metabolism protein